MDDILIRYLQENVHPDSDSISLGRLIYSDESLYNDALTAYYSDNADEYDRVPFEDFKKAFEAEYGDYTSRVESLKKKDSGPSGNLPGGPAPVSSGTPVEFPESQPANVNLGIEPPKPLADWRIKGRLADKDITPSMFFNEGALQDKTSSNWDEILDLYDEDPQAIQLGMDPEGNQMVNYLVRERDAIEKQAQSFDEQIK